MEPFSTSAMKGGRKKDVYEGIFDELPVSAPQPEVEMGEVQNGITEQEMRELL